MSTSQVVPIRYGNHVFLKKSQLATGKGIVARKLLEG